MRTSSPGTRRASSTALPSPQSSWPRAHYRLAGASVDVTDLLNGDFELVELLEHAVANLGIESTARSAEELLGYAEQVLTLMLDLQTDRIVELITRLTSAAAEQNALVQNESKQATGGTGAASRRLYAECTELNRLKGLAQSSDYAYLKPGGRDKFSGMRLQRLVDFIPGAVWIEMRIRLRAAGLLTPMMERKVARWIARGLDVGHAIEKAKGDVRPKCRD